jgi:uncharacterized protein (TIGR03382 family)
MQHHHTFALIAALIGISCGSEPQSAKRQGAISGQWASAGILSGPRGLFTIELRLVAIADGRVVVVGGAGSPNAAQTKVDVFSGTSFSTGSPLSVARVMPSPVALLDGGVLVAGGHSGTLLAPTTVSSAERWNPTTGLWTSTNAMGTKRKYASATRLADGRVLVSGGQDENVTHQSAEIWNPTTGTWTPATNQMALGRLGHVVALLPSGKVLVVGGGDDKTQTFPQAAEIFDPSAGAGTFSPGPNMIKAVRMAHVGARLLDGRILYCGACGPQAPGSAVCSGLADATCELYDAQSNTIISTGNLKQGSAASSMLTLATGQVLIAGGTSSGAALNRAELYDPATGSWSLTGTLAGERYDAGMALLPDGRVLIAGGRKGSTQGSTFLATTETYEPQGVPITCRVCQIDGTCVTLKDGTPCTSGACLAGNCVAQSPDLGADSGTQDAAIDLAGDGPSTVVDTSSPDKPSTGVDAAGDVGSDISIPVFDVSESDALADGKAIDAKAVDAAADAARDSRIEAKTSAEAGPAGGPGNEGGCACQSGSGSEPSALALVLAFLFSWLTWRRRSSRGFRPLPSRTSPWPTDRRGH